MKLPTQRTDRVSALLAALVVVLLASCNPAPKYVKPATPTPVAYKESAPQDFREGQGWKVAHPGDDKIRAKWWELYNDPQLNALEEQVPTGSQTLAAAEANYRAARALVVSAHAALYPTVGTSPAFTNNRISGTQGARVIGPNGSGGTSSQAPFNDYTLPLDVSYTVDFWHRIRNTIAANAFSAQASAADIATSLLSLQSELATDYFEVRALDMQEAVLQDTLNNFRDSLHLTQVLFRFGIDSEEDVSQAQTQLNTATAQATDIGVARAQFEHAIATLLGRPPAQFSLPAGTFVPKPPQIPVAVPSTLLERRPDIAAAERQIAAANAEIGVARAAYYPNISLSASAGFESSTAAQWFTWPSRFWALGPTLSQTIFDGGTRRAQNEQAQANYDAAVANYRQATLTAFQAVEDNLASLRVLSKEIGEQQSAITSSAHFLDLALTRYKLGVDSYLNVITAQTAVLTNRETLVQIQLRQMTASVALILALGGGWDESLPSMKDLLVKQRNWKPGGIPLPPVETGTAPANPPVVQPSTLKR
ncbi:MAG TPA: efflux transporter outer membrane subunit [Chthoniobacterales bacterium]|nr:efflux transporter outer membrane subunit [Chthoniobacterales bacterium]